MWVSHCVNETPWYKTHPGQAWSVHKLQCALRWFSSIDRLTLQTREVRDWWKDQCSQTWTSITFKIFTGEEEETSTVGAIHKGRKPQRNSKNPTSFFIWRAKKSAHTELDNDGRIRLTRHWKQQKKRQGKYSQVWSERLSNLTVPT